LRPGGGPAAGDVLAAGEREAERPAGHRRAVVGDRDVGGEAVAPVVLHRVRHVAATGGRRAGRRLRGGRGAGGRRRGRRRVGGAAGVDRELVGQVRHELAGGGRAAVRLTGRLDPQERVDAG